MPGRLHTRLGAAWRLVVHSLSGRLLLLTLVFIMLGEAVIFFPTIGRYHRSLLETRIDAAQIAILPFTEAGGEQLSAGLRGELLASAGASAVMLKRPDQRELFLVTEMPPQINVTVDLRDRGVFAEIYEAVECLVHSGDRVLRIVAPTRIKGAQTIEVVVGEKTIRAALVDYARRLLVVAFLLSAVTGVLVSFSLYLFFVRPMRRLTQAMIAFRKNPEDPSRIIFASTRKDEIGITERELGAMQRDIYGFLQQKGRLAALGTAVAKIQHDLRNILSSAQLASDRLARIDDPVVQRLAPRLVASIDRAVALATNTLRYGRADEPAPQRAHIALEPVVAEAGQAALAGLHGKAVTFANAVGSGLEIDADPEQLYRVLLNLLRNAVESVGEAGTVRVSAQRNGTHVLIDIADNGPGIAEDMAARLFQPFASVARPGGTGLGLAISRDLVRAHGGELALAETGPAGTRFRIDIPDTEQHGS